MKQFTSQELSAGENYKLLSGVIVPRSIAWVTTLNDDDSINVAPFSFFSSVPSARPLITLGISNKTPGVPKDTVHNLWQRGEAVVHITTRDNLTAMNTTAATLPYGDSEATLAQLKLTPSTKVAVPAIAGTKIRLETQLYQAVPVTDIHGRVDSYVVLLEVVNYVVDEQVIDDHYHTDVDQLNPVMRLSGPWYGTVGEKLAVERPK